MHINRYKKQLSNLYLLTLMKKFLYLPFLVLMLFACQEQDIESPTIPVQDAVAVATRPLLPGDPNLDPNWNWENDEWIVYLSDISGRVSSPLSYVNPFFNDPVYGDAIPSRRDLSAADGWMLVARDFGTPTKAPRVPYILLYNRYRGLLRVGALRTADLPTTLQSTTLKFQNNSIAPPLFRFTGETEQFATTRSGSLRWMISEFNVQGYSSSINQQAQFIVNIEEVTEQLIELKVGGTIEGEAQPKPSKKSKFLKANKTAYKVTSYTSKAWDKIKEKGDFNFKNVVSALTGVATGNPLALLNGAAGIIDSFTSSGKAPTYNISLKADLSADGTIVSSTPRATIEVYLQNNAIHNSQPRALRSIPWGVMNYTGNTLLYLQRVVTCGERSGCTKDQISTRAGFFDNILVINPAIANDIATIEAGWILSGQSSVAFRSLSSFKSSGFRRDYSPGSSTGRPTGIGIRLTFKNGDVVYNRIPTLVTG